MPNVGDSRSPQGVGIIPFRHRGYDQDSPSWDLDKRASVVGFEITGRDDTQTASSLGHWKEDVDTRGDLNCANYWQSDYSQRSVGCWGFGYASVVSKAGDPGNGQNTTGGQGDVTQTQRSNKMEVMPIGQFGKPDQRFKAKNPIVIQPEGQAGGDPNAPGVNGDPGNAGAGGPAGGGANGDPGAVDLGGGWQYYDGALVYNGPSANSIDSLGAGNFHSGFPGFGGVNNVAGGGSGFAGFSGVNNLAGGGSGFAGFSGVRNFFGGGRPGFSFSYGH